MRLGNVFASAVGGVALLATVGCQSMGSLARDAKDGAINMTASFKAGFDEEKAKYVAQVQKALNEAGCRDDQGRYIANDGRETVETIEAFDRFAKVNGGPSSDIFSKVTKREGIGYATVSDQGVLEVIQSAGKGSVKGCDPQRSGPK